MTKQILHSKMEEEVFQRLQQLGLKVQRETRVGGYEPDFVIRTKDGRTIVVEVKGWIGDPSHVERARQQVLSATLFHRSFLREIRGGLG